MGNINGQKDKWRRFIVVKTRKFNDCECEYGKMSNARVFRT